MKSDSKIKKLARDTAHNLVDSEIWSNETAFSFMGEIEGFIGRGKNEEALSMVETYAREAIPEEEVKRRLS